MRVKYITWQPPARVSHTRICYLFLRERGATDITEWIVEEDDEPSALMWEVHYGPEPTTHAVHGYA